jgi:hypothetical protein
VDTEYPIKKKMAIKLTPDEISNLKKQGYSDVEIQQAVAELEQEDLQGSYNEVNRQRSIDPRQNSQISSFTTRNEDNIVRWQLELNDILEKAEHILRGDVPKFQDGHIIWKENPNPQNNPLNEVGVQEIMKILALYVNRNKILADYTNKEINVKVFDFGRAINNLIFMRDEEFGMDTEQKRKNYEMLVTELKDIVHDTYKRALDGAEKRSLREMISVSQATNTSAQIGQGMKINDQGVPIKERGLLNPMRYVKGKY